MTSRNERQPQPDSRGIFQWPIVRVIKSDRAKLNDFLQGLLKSDPDGNVSINPQADPNIDQVLDLGQQRGHDVVLDIGEQVIAKAGQFLADNPRYVDAAKLAGVLAAGVGIGSVIGIVLHKHDRPDRPQKKQP